MGRTAEAPQEVQHALDAAREACGVPGVAMALYVEGARRFHGASGTSDLAGRVPLGADERFPVYSLTKTLTAVVALRLAEAGALDLDAPLAGWLPELDFAPHVSLRQLLQHTAGVPNYSVVESQVRALAASPGRAWSFDDFVRETCRRGLDFEPGRGWAYSNTGYMLMKRVLEEAGGRSFAGLVDAHVARPLSLERTDVLESVDAFHTLTPGYSEGFGAPSRPGDVRGRYDPGWCATGVAASTADEVCRIYEALFGGGLLAPASLRQMLDVVPVPGVDVPGTASYGLGLMALPDGPDGPWYGHGGGGPGYDLRASHWPALADRRVTLAVLCNTDRGDGAERTTDVVRRALLGLLDVFA